VVIAGAIVAELPAGPAGPPSKHKWLRFFYNGI
jgi:hypothetical protein